MRAFATVACGLAFCLAACSNDSAGPSPLRLRIQGPVTGSNSTPIEGAMVTLGAGGHFTTPSELTHATTDAQGRYSIEHTINLSEDDFGGCQLWLRVAAPGYATGGGAESSLRPMCISAAQRFDVTLRLL